MAQSEWVKKPGFGDDTRDWPPIRASGAQAAVNAGSQLPSCRPGSRGSHARRSPRRIMAPSPVPPLQAPDNSIRAVLGLTSRHPETPRPESVALMAQIREASEAELDDQYHGSFGGYGGYGPDHLTQGQCEIREMMQWNVSRQSDGAFRNNLAPLAAEIDAVCQSWNAYVGGRVSRFESLKAVAATKMPPKDPLQTAQAASLLLRLVRALPHGLQMHRMLEPLTREILEAIYHEWPQNIAALQQLSDWEVSVDSLSRSMPFYSLLMGHKALADEMRRKAEEATAERQDFEAQLEELKLETSTLRSRVQHLEHELHQAETAREYAEHSGEAAIKLYEDFRAKTRIAMSSYSDMQDKVQVQLADLRALQKSNRTNDDLIDDLRGQIVTLSAGKKAMEAKLSEYEPKLERYEHELLEIQQLRERLESYEQEELRFGVTFAHRIAQEVFGTSVQVLCGGGGGRLFALKGKSKEIMETVLLKLKSINFDSKALKKKVQKLEMQIKDLRQLVPVWDQDLVAEIDEAFTEASSHRQIFEMRHKKVFAALGVGKDVPAYLRASGFVRHIYISKAELEVFVQGFLDHLMSCINQQSMHHITSDFVHSELHKCIQVMPDFSSEMVTEFGYAFISSLDVYRDDPDFELCDWLLSGVIHPSVMQSQKELLAELRSLMKSCAEQMSVERMNRNNVQDSFSEGETVSKALFRGVLVAMFPDKTIERHSALRRAMVRTFKLLRDTCKTMMQDKAFITDIFEERVNGDQTPVIEEIRRQHLHEIIEFTAAVGRGLQKHCIESNGGRNTSTKDGTMDAKALRIVLETADPRIVTERLEQMVSRVFEETPGQEVAAVLPAREVFLKLRSGILLQPQSLWAHADAQSVVSSMLSLGLPKKAHAVRNDGPLRVLRNPLEKAAKFQSPENLIEHIDEQMVNRHHAVEDEADVHSSDEEHDGQD